MKTIGLIGGMSWASTVHYYRLINEAVAARLGGLHSAQILMYSFDFEQLAALQRADRWDEAARLVADAATRLQAAGADVLLIGSNTMHSVAEHVASSVRVPLIHVADATAAAIAARGIKAVGLLGTRFTMEQPFYVDKLEGHGLRVLVPDQAGRDRAHAIIFGELCRNVVTDESRDAFIELIDDLAARGAEAIILGCTEIMLLIGPEDCKLLTFDTTEIHALAAVDFALGAPQ